MLNKSSVRRKLARKQQRDLDLEISFMEGVVSRDPFFIEAWQVLSDDYSRRGKFADGLRVDEQLAKIWPKDPVILYNIACSHSLLGNIQESISMLTKAISEGFNDLSWLLKDRDMARLRKTKLFKAYWVKISMLQRCK